MAIYWTDLAKLVKDKGITPYRLAAEMGITPSAAYKLLKRKRAKIVEEATLDALCRVLECTPGDLLVRKAR